VIASSVENLAIEIRHLQRSEVVKSKNRCQAESSSAMPHKRNPVLRKM